MSEVTIAHPTRPKRRKTLSRDKAERYLNAAWTVVDAPEPLPEDGYFESFEPAPGLSLTEAPTGTVAEVLAWVDGDSTRAQFALDAERFYENPRSTLIDQLETIANPPEGEKETEL